MSAYFFSHQFLQYLTSHIQFIVDALLLNIFFPSYHRLSAEQMVGSIHVLRLLLLVPFQGSNSSLQASLHDLVTVVQHRDSVLIVAINGRTPPAYKFIWDAPGPGMLSFYSDCQM